MRSIFVLFVTEKEDLNTKKEAEKSGEDFCYPKSEDFCSDISDRLSFNPNGSIYRQDHVRSSCAYSSIVGWGILIQYMLLVKLFLTTLLTAMFSHTKARVDAESDQIWMYQRYEIVIDYEHRLRLPPPLIIISYLIMLTKWIVQRKKRSYIYEYRRGKSLFFDRSSGDFVTENTAVSKRPNGGGGETTTVSTKDKPRTSEARHSSHHIVSPLMRKQIDHTLYWKIIVQDFAKKLDDSAREKDIQKEQAIGLNIYFEFIPTRIWVTFDPVNFLLLSCYLIY